MTSIASGGCAFMMLPPEVPPLRASLWRTEAMALLLLPLFAIQWLWLRPKDRSIVYKKQHMIRLVVAGLALAGWTGTFAVSLSFTSMTRVYLLNNCQPVLMVIWLKLTRKPVTLVQGLGTAVGFMGLALTVCSGLTQDAGIDFRQLTGDCIAFIGAICACVFISNGSRLRSQMPVFVYLFPLTIIAMLGFAAVTAAFERTLPADLVLWKEIAILAWLTIITGLLGTTLVGVVMKWLPSLLISVVLLCEPVVATMLAVALRLEPVPDAWLFAGGGVLLVGVAIVTVSFARSKTVSNGGH